MNRYINKYLLLPALALAAVACDQDDLTGEHSLTATNPTISVNIPNNTASFVEKDSTFEFVIELSEPQIADVAIYVKQIDGDAVEGQDFTIGTSVVIIPATRTRGVASISVNSDNVAEDTETFVIQIGDERTGNASIEPKTISFTITNYTESELPITLSWAADMVDATGEPIDATDIANLVLYITNENGTVIPGGTINGTTFEEFVFTEDLPDGVYLIKAGISGVIEPGDLGTVPMLDLSIDYSQTGKIAESNITFPAAFDTKLMCSENRYTIARVEKSGSNYTVTEVGEAAPAPTEPMEGNYGGVDGTFDGIGHVSPADVDIALDGDTYTIQGLNVDFMEAVWGEEVIASVPVEFTVDEEGNITIEDQYIFTTLYDGDEYEYRISGTGRIVDACGTIVLEYEMDQDGFLVGEWLHANGYMTEEKFTAVLRP